MQINIDDYQKKNTEYFVVKLEVKHRNEIQVLIVNLNQNFDIIMVTERKQLNDIGFPNMEVYDLIYKFVKISECGGIFVHVGPNFPNIFEINKNRIIVIIWVYQYFVRINIKYCFVHYQVSQK